MGHPVKSTLKRIKAQKVLKTLIFHFCFGYLLLLSICRVSLLAFIRSHEEFYLKYRRILKNFQKLYEKTKNVIKIFRGSLMKKSLFLIKFQTSRYQYYSNGTPQHALFKDFIHCLGTSISRNRLIRRIISNIYLNSSIEKNWRSQNLDFPSLQVCFVQAPAHADAIKF